MKMILIYIHLSSVIPFVREPTIGSIIITDDDDDREKWWQTLLHTREYY